jgi:hypothetical protein
VQNLCLTAILTFLPLLAGPAWGQEVESPPTPGVGDLTEPPDSLQSTVDIGIGFSKVGEDYYIDTAVGFSFGIGDFEAGLLVPLRFLIIDEPPEDADLIRSADWDETSDYMRVIRYLQYGNRHDTFYIRAGELNGVVIGHGTIVNGYNNNVDINHFQWGINTAVNMRHGGVEAMMDNLVSPEVIGMRGYLRPWEFFDPESWWTRLAFGISVVGDVDAPSSLILTETGEYVFDSEENLAVAEREGTGILGIDLELQVYTDDLVSITPYTDVNFHLGEGTGLHIGNLANFTLSELVALNTLLELRVLGAGYLPDYFDGLYEVERFLFLPVPGDFPTQRRPKLQWLGLVEPDAVIGWYGEGTLGVLSTFYLTLGYEDYEGDDNSAFFARLSLPQVGPVTVGAYYVNQSFDGIGELFDLENALFVSEARFDISSPLYGIVQYSRRFSATSSGEYEPVDDFAVGLGLSFGF